MQIRSESSAKLYDRKMVKGGCVEEEKFDDPLQGITFKSFNIEDVLGEGTFGKVFKVNLKSDPTKKQFAMKVLRK